MGNRPVEIFLLCDSEDTPLAKALSEQLSRKGIVSLYGHDPEDETLDQSLSVAICVGEHTGSVSPTVCEALQKQLHTRGFRVAVIFLPNAHREDSVWLPEHRIDFKSNGDTTALRDLVAFVRPPIQVFLCHSTGDKAIVRDLHAFLASEGFRPWLDEKDLIAGEEWEPTLRRAIRASHVVIVCLSRSSVTKAGFVQRQIGFALNVADEQPEGSIFLIPLRLEECQVPDRLRKWQWVDLWTPDGHQKLIRALRLRADELAIAVAPGLNVAEVSMLASWRPPPLGKAVLIVDDNPDLLRFMDRFLKQSGWTIVMAESAQSLDAIEYERMPNIAAVDYILPDRNGVELAAQLRKHMPTMAIIIMSSAELNERDLITCAENDFWVLMKPFLAKEVIKLLDQIRREQIGRHSGSNADAIK